MDDAREGVEEFISEGSDRTAALREVVAIDGRNDRLTSDAVPVDSEENRGDVETTTPSTNRSSRAAGRILALLALAGALALVIGVRVGFIHDLVFRNGDVVLAGNDPYRYRYWIERLIAGSPRFDADSLATLPRTLENDDVLTVVVMWATARALGGTARAVGVALAWLPVVAGVVSAVLVYLMTTRLTADRWAGVVAVALLAITPIHAFRTALGFADHHAFDYVWLALTALSVVVLAMEETEATWRLRAATATLGMGVASQTLAWRGGPLLLLPIALYVPFKAILDVGANRSPLVANRRLAVGLGFGAALTYSAHLIFGWLPAYRALAPALLLGAVLAVLVVAGGAARLGASTGATATLVLTALALASVVVLVGFSDPIGDLFAYLRRTRSAGIMEAAPLLGSGWEFVRRPLRAFGLVLFVAMPYLAWGNWVAFRERHPGLLAVSAYAWYFLVLSLVQLRFAGKFSLFVAPFAGVGIVHLASKGSVRRRPIGFDPRTVRDRSGPRLRLPSGRTVVVVLLVVLLVGSTGVLVSFVRMMQIGVQDDTYETATWMDEYSDRNGLTYPDNYVFSDWGRNRVYNYFVNGESASYWYAATYYYEFLNSESPDRWFDEHSMNRAGFVVTQDNFSEFSDRTAYSRLHERFGSRGNGVSGLSHYRAVYANDDGSQKVFQVVPGATVTGTAAPGETVTVSKRVHLDGARFTYRRTVRANPRGIYTVTVPYAGEYEVNGARKSVPEDAVTDGKRVKWHDRRDRSPDV